MSPLVSVVIPTYRRPEMLARCIRMLLAQESGGIPYEIVVADDAGDPETEAFVERARDPLIPVRYAAVRGHHGPAAARNAGWRLAEGKIIAFTDDDCMPSPQWLRSGIEALERGAAAAWGRTHMPLRSEPTDYEKNASGLERAGFITANCFVRRAVLEVLGGFDERFTRAWREDSDLYFQLLTRGFSVVPVREALVVHPVRPAPWGVSIRQQKNNFFDALLFRKHPRLFQEHIGAVPPWRYYAIVLSSSLALVQLLNGRQTSALLFLLAWLLLTGHFFYVRTRGTSRRFRDILDMAVTSIIIPYSAVYWRIRGALRFRAVFF